MLICKCGETMKYLESACTEVNTMYICKCGKLANESICFDYPIFECDPILYKKVRNE